MKGEGHHALLKYRAQGHQLFIGLDFSQNTMSKLIIKTAIRFIVPFLGLK